MHFLSNYIFGSLKGKERIGLESKVDTRSFV